MDARSAGRGVRSLDAGASPCGSPGMAQQSAGPMPALQHPHSLIQLALISWVKDIGDLSPKTDAGFPGCEVVG